MNASNLATWTELLELKTVWIVTTILLSDVVTLFALDAGHSDLWADIRALACHRRAPFTSVASEIPLVRRKRRLLEPAYLTKFRDWCW